MQTECTPSRFEFEAVGRHAVVAQFDGGTIASNAGALLLRQADRRGLGLIRRFARCFTDRRDPRYVEHSVETASHADAGNLQVPFDKQMSKRRQGRAS